MMKRISVYGLVRCVSIIMGIIGVVWGPWACGPTTTESVTTYTVVADEDGGDGEISMPDEPTWLERIAATGVVRYLDNPIVGEIESVDGDETVYGFDPDDGPLCLRGGSYRLTVRDRNSANLLIFLQGGGACWSRFCLAVNAAPAGIPGVDALRTDLETNPLRDWNVVYLPYCDGSMFGGDRDHDDDGDGNIDRWHRGLYNLSAALQVGKKRFPKPERIVLAGSSAGGFGTILGVLLVRTMWPDVPIDVIADSGTGVSRPGDVAFLTTLLDEFGLLDTIPPDCERCVSSGHIAPLWEWTLEHDPLVRVAVFSAYFDSIMTDVFLQLPPEDFRDALVAETGRIANRFPDRYKRFLIDGVTHTVLLGNPIGIIGSDITAVELPPNSAELFANLHIGSLAVTLGDLTVGEWLDRFVHGDPTWADMVGVVETFR